MLNRRVMEPTTYKSRAGRMRSRTLNRFGLSTIAIALVVIATACISFDKAGIMQVKTGYRAATVTIFRHASRDLGHVCYTNTHFYDQGSCAAGILRTGADQANISGFARARWMAATAPDQHADIRGDLGFLVLLPRCLAVKMQIGAGLNIGYSWFTYDFGEGGCVWGVDTAPNLP
mgnify:CR=1 FL=1